MENNQQLSDSSSDAKAVPHRVEPTASEFRSRLFSKFFIVLTTIHLLFAIYSLLVLRWRPPYNGPLKPYLPIHAGELLYARMPRQYWEHRILMLKAMGVNSLSTYVVWNFHQIRRGVFDFENGERNLTAFLQLAQKHGMRVLIRPGPYICAEWDFGGLPPRLIGIQGIKIRSTDPEYEAEVRMYFAAVAKVIKPFLKAQGGPIIMLQIQNQYGYVATTGDHSQNLIKMWRELEIQSEFYIEDAAQLWQKNYWPGAHIAVSQTSGLLKYLQLDLSPKLHPDSYVFGGEVYAGWFTDWGEGGWQSRPAQSFAKHVDNLLRHNRSVNIFVAFGGTSFGATAGANGFNPLYDYIPHVTSYDEDSPVTEHGRATPKYFKLREAFQRYYGSAVVLPAVPEPPQPMAVISGISIEQRGSLFSNRPPPTLTGSPLTYFQSNELQMYNQGLLLYETTLPEARRYLFQLVIRDFAVIFVDDSFVSTLTRGVTEIQKISLQCKAAPCQLRIVVQAMGHINFGKKQGQDKKGLISFEERAAKGKGYLWKIYKFQLQEIRKKWTKMEQGPSFPAIHRGVIQVEAVGDTFLDMRGWGKGFLWVNGRNLGRFWAIGPQYRLYCPGAWLKKGQNQIVVLELTGNVAGIAAYGTMQ